MHKCCLSQWIHGQQANSMHMRGEGANKDTLHSDRHAREEDIISNACMSMLHLRVHVRMCAHIPHKEHPTHSPSMTCSRFSVDVLKQWKERSSTIHPLTLIKGTPFKVTPMHLPDVSIQPIWIVARTCCPSIIIYTHMHVNTCKHTI